MLINTDALIPFMPRALQRKVKPVRFNIKKIEKEEKSKNDLDSDANSPKSTEQFSHYILRHHQKPYQDDTDATNTADNQTKHIDILA